MAEPAREAQRVLVTGAAGFIGFHLAARLLGAGARVHGLDNLNAYYDVEPEAGAARSDRHARAVRLLPSRHHGLRRPARAVGRLPPRLRRAPGRAGGRSPFARPSARLYRGQPRRLPRRARGLSRAPGPPPRLCVLELGLWGQQQGAVPRGRPGPGTPIALRRDQARQRADGPDLRPSLRHRLLRRALLHGVRALGTTRHGLLRLHQGHPGRAHHRRVQPRAHAARFHLHRRRDGGAGAARRPAAARGRSGRARHRRHRTSSTMSAITPPSSSSASSPPSKRRWGARPTSATCRCSRATCRRPGPMSSGWRGRRALLRRPPSRTALPGSSPGIGRITVRPDRVSA